ncbi:MAG TPA: ABC transporter permease, partial [Blastocatellia bacterium]|nr:ABC transporter permease [Blastocatellia bacterium]
MASRPTFSLTVILTIGLCTGVNISAFSLVSALLLKGVPYAKPKQLVLIDQLPLVDFAQSRGAFNSWKTESSLLADASVYAVGESSLLGGAEPQRIRVANVSANFFDVLGVEPALWRAFLPEEESSKQVFVALISDRLWRGQFGGDRSVIGRSIELNNDRFTVIGVVSRTCDFPAGTDIWTPTAHSMRAWLRSHAVASTILARMRPGVVVAQADTQQRGWLQSQP